jgi:hypothetical protein
MTDSTEAQPEQSTPEPKPEERTRKIAVLGSACSSVGLAPYQDDSWEIWGCSPANKDLPRVDLWFELHNPEVKIREGLAGWMEWLSKQPNLYMQKASPEYPTAKEYPLIHMIKRWGRYWWTSQLSYMLALAIEQNPKAIGIYGVDMAANSEYNQQRLACQFFIMEMAKQGIDIVIPPESDLLEPPPLYGYCESSRQFRKYMARMNELRSRINDLSQKEEKSRLERLHLIGAMDDMEYQTAHWANRMDFIT